MKGPERPIDGAPKPRWELVLTPQTAMALAALAILLDILAYVLGICLV